MKKIMFNDKYGLTQSVLNGHKTMTRRVVPERVLDEYYDYDDYVNAVAPQDIPYSREYEEGFFMQRSHFDIGEIVAVAQSYMDAGYDPHLLQLQYIKEPTITTFSDGIPVCGYVEAPIMYHKGWKNKMYVSPTMMPHQICITNVRVEHLQGISEEECLCEGVRFYNCGIDYGYRIEGIRSTFSTARDAFAALINKVSGKGTWESNPYVFVYEFELVKL